MPKSVEPQPTMKIRMSRILRSWVYVEYGAVKDDQSADLTKLELIAQILREFEEAGDAMRFLTADGRVGWKATPRMLTRLADAEQEARDDLAAWWRGGRRRAGKSTELSELFVFGG